MAKILDGNHLTIEDVVAVARDGETLELAPQAEEAIRRCREMLERNPPRFAKLMGLHMPTGWRAEGPERMMLARRQLCETAGSVSLYPG